LLVNFRKSFPKGCPLLIINCGEKHCCDLMSSSLISFDVCSFRGKCPPDKKNPFLDKWIEKIVKVNPKVLGFTLYFCNSGPVDYAVKKLKATEVHMYGFDSLFDMNLRSYTDFVLNSDRGAVNNVRLNDKWRPIWQGIFNEFKDTKWVLHHNHDQLKFSVGENVETFVHKK